MLISAQFQSFKSLDNAFVNAQLINRLIRLFFDFGEASTSPLKNPPFFIRLINFLCMTYRAHLWLSFDALIT